MHETKYQHDIAVKIEDEILPGSIVLWNDPSKRQGIPDLIVLYGPGWAGLEVKMYEGAPERPNQGHYVGRMNDMSFGAFIYPENEEEVLYALQQSLGAPG